MLIKKIQGSSGIGAKIEKGVRKEEELPITTEVEVDQTTEVVAEEEAEEGTGMEVVEEEDPVIGLVGE